MATHILQETTFGNHYASNKMVAQVTIGFVKDARFHIDVQGFNVYHKNGLIKIYAPTTLAPARDFWLLHYTSVLEDGSLEICERSLNNTQNGPSMPPVQSFVRAEMIPIGYLIRPCEGGGSIIHVVDHMDLEPWSIPKVLCPLYESSTLLAQKTTMAALRHLRKISQEVSQRNATGWGRKPAALRAPSQKLSRGFAEAVNGFTDDGWPMLF